jgi:hypothetical protein
MQRGVGEKNSKKLKLAAYIAAGSLLLSPVLVPAFATQLYPTTQADMPDWAKRFTPAGVDSRLAEKMRSDAMASRQAAFPFTPAGLDRRPTDTLTIAVRADSSNAVSVRNAIAQMEAGAGTSIRLNNSNYQLTASRGWQSFNLPAVITPAPQLEDIVGKGSFRLDDGAKKKPSRFNTDVKLDAARGVAPNPRGNAAAGDYKLDVEGRLRVAKGVDLTAGVRYSREDDRVDPASTTKADNEAVYVGTKIKF